MIFDIKNVGKDYKDAAETSATNAKTSETNSKTSETNAISANQSAQSALTLANTAATNASTSASNAKTSETNAAASATQAQNAADGIQAKLPINLIIPIYEKNGFIDILYSDLELTFEKIIYPIIQVLCVKSYFATILSVSNKGFTVQLFNENLEKNIDTEKNFCSGEIVCGEKVCGDNKSDSTVNLIVKIIQ